MVTLLMSWWTRRKFYTFHKDEMISHNHFSSFMKSGKCVVEDEWNNESESGDELDLDGENCLSAFNVERKPKIERGATNGNQITYRRQEASAPKERALHGPRPKFDRYEKKSTVSASSPLPFPEYPCWTPPGISLMDDSFSASLESMDSLVGSHRDDASVATPRVTNIPEPAKEAFFVEHVRFMQVQTQPRKVEAVYQNSDAKRGCNYQIPKT